MAPPSWDKSDRALVLNAVRDKGQALQFVPPQLQGDREVVMLAVKQDPLALAYAAEELREDDEVLLTAMRGGGDRPSVMQVLRFNGAALCLASEALRADREVVLEAVQWHRRALLFASEGLKADVEVVLAAVRGDSGALLYAREELKRDRLLGLRLVQTRGRAIRFLAEELRADRDLVLAAVRQDSGALEFAAGALQEELLRAAAPRPVRSPSALAIKATVEKAPVLRPSLVGAAAQAGEDLVVVQELPGAGAPVTCLVFGQERLHRGFVLLALGANDGSCVVYRLNRTELELEMVREVEFREEGAVEGNLGQVLKQCSLLGHENAITSMAFNAREDELVTTSFDKTTRFWSLASAEMLRVFTDSSVPTIARFFPRHPQFLVEANSNAMLWIVNTVSGIVLQKFAMHAQVRALCFDSSGLFLLAGTSKGSVQVLEVTEKSGLSFKFDTPVASESGVTHLHHVPATEGRHACLLVNTTDGCVKILDILRAPTGALLGLSLRHSLSLAHSVCPLKCSYSPSGQGYAISGSEDADLYIWDLDRQGAYELQRLSHHRAPVIVVAVNMEDSLMASADGLGHLAIWRRLQPLEAAHQPIPL